jgi:chorismate dehydratase
MRRLIVGSVPYMNGAPLTRWFETDAGRRVAEVRYAVPSVLARWLESGEVDVALVSSVEWFRRPGTRFVPGLGIATRREALSVRLFSKVPFERIQQVALDESSLTSSLLLKLLLKHLYGIQPRYENHPPNLEAMLQKADAALLIGDAGMAVQDSETYPYVMDLGEAWWRWTGLPFIWALWLTNEDAPLPLLTDLMHTAYAWGEAHLDAIIESEAERTGLSRTLCDRYLREVMTYRIDDSFLQGLERFRAEVSAVCPGLSHSL